jgi:hypothetical protein
MEGEVGEVRRVLARPVSEGVGPATLALHPAEYRLPDCLEQDARECSLRDLPLGALFLFKAREPGALYFAPHGAPHDGPWRKVGARRYRHPTDPSAGHGTCPDGFPSVRRLDPEDTPWVEFRGLNEGEVFDFLKPVEGADGPWRKTGLMTYHQVRRPYVRCRAASSHAEVVRWPHDRPLPAEEPDPPFGARVRDYVPSLVAFAEAAEELIAWARAKGADPALLDTLGRLRRDGILEANMT